MNKNML